MRDLGRLGREHPGFVEIDLVGHEGGGNIGDFGCSLVTDIATGWRSLRD
jgi:hypothetical protein